MGCRRVDQGSRVGAESIHSPPFPAQSTHYIDYSDGAPPGMSCVEGSSMESILEKHLQHAAHLFIHDTYMQFEKKLIETETTWSSPQKE